MRRHYSLCDTEEGAELKVTVGPKLRSRPFPPPGVLRAWLRARVHLAHSQCRSSALSHEETLPYVAPSSAQPAVTKTTCGKACTTEMYCLMVPEFGSLGSRCLQGCFLLEPWRRLCLIHPWSLPSGGLLESLAFRGLYLQDPVSAITVTGCSPVSLSSHDCLVGHLLCSIL